MFAIPPMFENTGILAQEILNIIFSEEYTMYIRFKKKLI